MGTGFRRARERYGLIHYVVGVALGLAIVGVGCSSSSTTDLRPNHDDAGTAACTPGATRQCVGPGACKGGQKCSPASQWTDCDCGASPSSGGAPGGGFVGSGGSVSSGGSVAGSGGSGGAGGSANNGGAAGSGGTIVTDGSVGSGGTPSSGGFVGSGGSVSSGGMIGNDGSIGSGGNQQGTGGAGTGGIGPVACPGTQPNNGDSCTGSGACTFRNTICRCSRVTPVVRAWSCITVPDGGFVFPVPDGGSTDGGGTPI